ncbi:MAG TPA: NAD(P)-dependent oxidoreductase [Polyangiaceae bacterium]|jgi:phosphoglycerate dehydrogenase-like enzyme|nr:NAD(P)-dependent oxidoreductase [Polyangiaceae bacterium]
MRILLWLANPVRAFEPTSEQLAALRARVSHELVAAPSESEFLAQLPAADAVVVWRFLPEWYARAPRLRHSFTPSAGHDPLPADPTRRVERHFGSFQGLLMAESLVAMITFLNCRLGAALQGQAARRWDRAPFSERRRLHGQVALIIGYGAIGQHCGRLLSALGMVVHGLRRDVTRPSPWVQRMFSPAERLEALALADHVICVLPGDTGTDHFLDATALGRMKPSSCLYNLGRGNAIDIIALGDALTRGRIAGAFLDVTPEEPLPASSGLWTLPNLYLSPHASAIGAEYLDLYFEQLAGELEHLS